MNANILLALVAIAAVSSIPVASATIVEHDPGFDFICDHVDNSWVCPNWAPLAQLVDDKLDAATDDVQSAADAWIGYATSLPGEAARFTATGCMAAPPVGHAHTMCLA